MTQEVNPFDYLPEAHVRRQMKVVSRRLTRRARKGKLPEDFETQRGLLRTLTEAMTRKQEVKMLESMAEITSNQMDT